VSPLERCGLNWTAATETTNKETTAIEYFILAADHDRERCRCVLLPDQNRSIQQGEVAITCCNVDAMEPTRSLQGELTYPEMRAAMQAAKSVLRKRERIIQVEL
jgi:hypothetical protein